VNADEIILHHYPASPFSEKIRLVFGIKRLAWRSVEIPNMMPKPDLIPLTGGYRKTPVMQIGADIFCDTQIIIREIEKRHPAPTLFPNGEGLALGLAFWTDRIFFIPTVAVIFGEIGDLVPEAFKKDRAAMSGSTFSTDAMKGAAPFARDQVRAHLDFIAGALARHMFLEGDAPGAADVHAMMNVWFLRNALPHVAKSLLEEFPAIDSWMAKLQAFGQGDMKPLDSKEALAIAREAEPYAIGSSDRHDPNGLAPGQLVTVSADDYGRDPVAGEIVFSNAHEIAIRRDDPQVGKVVVHFPRAGFNVSRASGASAP
jgi:glutathione S-transferase